MRVIMPYEEYVITYTLNNIFTICAEATQLTDHAVLRRIGLTFVFKAINKLSQHLTILSKSRATRHWQIQRWGDVTTWVLYSQIHGSADLGTRVLQSYFWTICVAW